MSISAPDLNPADQRVEYVCPRCDGVVARDDPVCPHCGQALEAIAAAGDERPVPPPTADGIAATHVSIGSLLGAFLGVSVGALLLTVGAVFALLGLVGLVIALSERSSDDLVAGLVFLWIAVGLGAAGVSLVRRARRSWSGRRRATGDAVR
jgi:hypothetical protein